MVFKLVRTDTVEPCKIKLPIGTHLVGRGKFLDCDDKRVSRNHGELLVTEDTVTIKSLHQNPCFYMKCGSDETQILMQNCTVDLNNGDKFGLLPDIYWYEVLLCVLSDSPEPNIKEDQQEDVRDYSDSDDTETTKHSSDTVVNNVAAQEITKLDESSIDPIESETLESIERSESPSLLPSEKPSDQTNEPLAAPNGGTEEQDSNRKRTHSLASEPGDEVKKVKTESSETIVKQEPSETVVKQEPSETVVKQEPENAQPGPSNAQVNPQNPSDPDAGKDQGKPPTKPAQGPLRERCVYGAGCYRRNPQHKAQFSHPADADWGAGVRGQCPWGARCRRRDPRHWHQHDHPPAAQPPPPPPHAPPPPGNTRKTRKRSNSQDKDLILQGKRARKTVKRPSWSGSESENEYDMEDPFMTDESDEWEPPTDMSQNLSSLDTMED